MRLNTKLTSVPLALAALILSQSALSMSGSVDEQSKKKASPQTEATTQSDKGAFVAEDGRKLKYDPKNDAEDRGQRISEAEFMQAVKRSFLVNDEQEWKRFSDPTLKTCNVSHDKPDMEQAKSILAREKASIVLPEHGRYMGDWKQGKNGWKAHMAGVSVIPDCGCGQPGQTERCQLLCLPCGGSEFSAER